MTIDMTFERREEIFRKEDPVPNDLVTRIMGEKDFPTLSNWLKIAVKCDSIDDFILKSENC